MSEGLAQSGLEGVIAAHTVLSDVDGAHGRLVIRGYAVEDLAGQTSFEQAAHLLFDGFFDDLPPPIWRRPSARPGSRRSPRSARWMRLLAKRDPVEAMRALLARLPDGDDLSIALLLLAAPAVFTPAVLRVAAGKAPIAPDPALSHAADILRMTRGQPANDAETQGWTPISSPSATTASTPRPSRLGSSPRPARA
jgi:citrate synthase